jgi:hypothetical protein
MPLYPDEILFIKENFFKLNNAQLLKHCNNHRGINEQINSLTTFRWWVSKQIGIKRQNKPKPWTEAELKILLKYWRIMGDVELADLLNQFSDRSRNFTKNHIDKKRFLLGLKRTEEDLKNIIKRNCKRKRFPGRKEIHKIGDIWLSSANYKTNDKRWYIKTKTHNRYSYARYLWEQENGAIPKGSKVYFKDKNPRNCSIENLYVDSPKGIRYNDPYKKVKDVLELIDMKYDIVFGKIFNEL